MAAGDDRPVARLRSDSLTTPAWPLACSGWPADRAKLPRVRDLETIDSELRLLFAIRHMAREAEGRTPNTRRIYELQDERAEPPGQDLVAAQPVQCHHKAGRDHLNRREKQTMAEESDEGLSEQIKELVTESEKHMKAIQDQIAHQWEAQQKAIGDLVEQQWKTQQKAIAELLERGQERSVKTAEQWEALRKAIADQIEQQWNAQRKAITDLAEGQWNAQKKAIEDAQNAIGGLFRRKPE